MLMTGECGAPKTLAAMEATKMRAKAAATQGRRLGLDLFLRGRVQTLLLSMMVAGRTRYLFGLRLRLKR